ncbi:hypothetical protein JNUCC0626_20925 [Lentzea sp. JNUCC 0626]|uniref:hypothetical protein n=1 Tax=Lentzea sp. JNUCC 0626 TaxID=3367513 RepID=UPI003749F486
MAHPTAGTILLGPPITRDEVIVRAKSWLRPSVSFHPGRRFANEHGRYRTDSSGFVCMALALPQTSIEELTAFCSLISRDDLLAGDLLICACDESPTRHAIVFESWADRFRRSYLGMEQVRDIGTVRRTVHYPYDQEQDAFLPRRYPMIRDAALFA